MFIVHREGLGLPNMEFLMHDSGICYYEPTKKDLVLLNTVSKNKEGFSKIQSKGAVKNRELHHTLVFTTIKEVKWTIISNQIQDFPENTKEVDNVTTRKKPIQVTEYIIIFPKEF